MSEDIGERYWGQSPITHENRSAEGIIGLGTDYKKDVEVKHTMNYLRGFDQDYNGVSNNCSDYAKSGVQTASGTRVNADKKVSGIFSSRNVTTPNQLYNQTRGLQNAVVLKNPGNAVNNVTRKQMCSDFGN